VDGDGTFETRDKKKDPVFDTDITVQHTGGCKCNDILDCWPGKKKGSRDQGCPLGILQNWIDGRGPAPECR